jgi:hypothetical protein
MTNQIESWATWILVRIQFVTANLDPEVLQWPGGRSYCMLSLVLCNGTVVLVGRHRLLGRAIRVILVARELWDGRPHSKRHQCAKVEMLVTT